MWSQEFLVRNLIGIAFAGMVATSANAFVVTVSGLGDQVNGSWDISLVTDGDATLALMETQPWWGSENAANIFSSALKCELGCNIPVPELGGLEYPPLFAWAEYSASLYYPIGDYAASSTNPNGVNGAFTYAVAERVDEVPEPSTLALGGLAVMAASLASRRRRHH